MGADLCEEVTWADLAALRVSGMGEEPMTKHSPDLLKLPQTEAALIIELPKTSHLECFCLLSFQIN